MRKIFLGFILVAVMAGSALAGPLLPAKPKAGDKCATCGMFVASSREFLGQVAWRDGSRVFFDGAKDMFKYLGDLKKYAPGRQASAIAAIYVTDYYSLKPVDARAAWYVVGSNINGPMGKELIAFGKEADAAEFKKDHQGKRIVRFADVTPALLATLE